MRRQAKDLAAIAVALCIAAAGPSSHAGPGEGAIANAGTLTCTIETPDQNATQTDLIASCSFENLTGEKAQLDATIARIGSDAGLDAKRVLIWAVKGPTSDIEFAALEGRYVGAIAADSSSGEAVGMRGGRDDNISLVPLSPEPDGLKDAALSVMQLTLSSMKA